MILTNCLHVSRIGRRRRARVRILEQGPDARGRYLLSDFSAPFFWYDLHIILLTTQACQTDRNIWLKTQSSSRPVKKYSSICFVPFKRYFVPFLFPFFSDRNAIKLLSEEWLECFGIFGKEEGDLLPAKPSLLSIYSLLPKKKLIAATTLCQSAALDETHVIMPSSKREREKVQLLRGFFKWEPSHCLKLLLVCVVCMASCFLHASPYLPYESNPIQRRRNQTALARER